MISGKPLLRRPLQEGFTPFSMTLLRFHFTSSEAGPPRPRLSAGGRVRRVCI